MKAQPGQIRLLILAGHQGFSAGLLLERIGRCGPTRPYAPDDWKVEILATGEKTFFGEYYIGRELNPLEVLAYASVAP